MKHKAGYINNKLYYIIVFLLISNSLLSQELTFKMEDFYQNPEGLKSDIVTLVPLFRLDTDFLYGKKQRMKIKKLPNNFDNSSAAYGFIGFNGVKESLFDNALAFVIENYQTINPKIYVDRNGNLDFSDDGKAIVFKNSTTLELNNTTSPSAIHHLVLNKSSIKPQFADRLTNKYQSVYPDGDLIEPKYWLTAQRLLARVSTAFVENKPISILLYDGSIDGLFTYQKDNSKDKILIIDNKIEQGSNISNLIRQGQPINMEATFLLYGKEYSLVSVSKKGDSVTIKASSIGIKKIYTVGDDLSKLSFELLSKEEFRILDVLSQKKYVLIYAGGTWCAGCIAQEPIIKKLYKQQKVEVIGLYAYDTVESVSKYINKHQLEWPIGLMSDSFKESFNINSYPTYILISQQGEILQITMNASIIEEYILSAKN